MVQTAKVLGRGLIYATLTVSAADKCKKEKEEMPWRRRFTVDKREHLARGRHTSGRVQTGHDPESGKEVGRGTRCNKQEAQKRTG